MSLKGKHVLVTGGNDGLGLEIVKQLLEAGAKVTILGKDEEKLKLAKFDLDSNYVTTINCDLRDGEQIRTSMAKLDKLDMLVNCAGIVGYQPLDKHDPTNIKDIIDTNLIGLILLTREVFAKFKKQNSGTILNVSSTSGLPTGGHPYQAVYMGSKFGVYGFTEGLKAEVNAEKLNINVLGFYPGGMNTNLFKKSGDNKDTSNFMDPAEVAKVIAFMLDRPDGIKMDHVVVNRNKNV